MLTLYSARAWGATSLNIGFNLGRADRLKPYLLGTALFFYRS